MDEVADVSDESLAEGFLTRFDRNHDFKLDREEVRAWVEDNEQRSGEAAPDGEELEQKTDGMFMMADADDDGIMTYTELMTFAKKMRTMDGDGDESISGVEENDDSISTSSSSTRSSSTKRRRRRKKKKEKKKKKKKTTADATLHDEL